MFSRLDSIFKTQERHAESLDTRQAIRRHEDQQQRSKGDDKKKNDDDALWQDSTTLSISGLQSFLEGLIAEQNTAGKTQQSGTTAPQAETAEEKQPDPLQEDAQENPQMRERNTRAAMAYQRTQQTSYPEQAIHSSNKQQGSVDAAGSNSSNMQLTSTEARAIHQIIADLKKLSARGYTELTLQKADSLLQGIIDAIALIKSTK